MREHNRRSARWAALLTGCAMVLGAGVATADPDELDGDKIGSAADFGEEVPEAPSLEEMLKELGDDVVVNRWFVETKPGTAETKVVKEAEKIGVDIDVERKFDSLWNGLSVTADLAEAEKLTSLGSVVAVYPVVEVERPFEPASSSIDMDAARRMTGADIANTELGLTGKGVRVGIIDTGIDYNHPDLGGSGTNNEIRDFPNSRVKWGYDFVGDDYDSSSPDTDTPDPDRWPDDCGGHGTHVAGITGASGEISGVAPEVEFGAYRVFGCDGTTSSDIILAAMEQAAADEMDIVNMSIGASFATWPSYPTAVAAEELAKKGITVVVSQGNSGAAGTFSGGAPAVAPSVIAVGSVENEYYMASTMKINDGKQIPFNKADGAPEPEAGASYSVNAAYPLRACDPLEPAPSEGMAVLIERGDCTFHAKALNAEEAGYEAVIIFNNTDGPLVPGASGEPPLTIPVIGISQEDGKLLRSVNGLKVTIDEGESVVKNPLGGTQASSSSYGLAADLTLKPDLSAPGAMIRSTYPLEEGKYAALSGTSMAAPHVAGAAALLLEAKPQLDPMMVRSALTNTADPFVFAPASELGLFEPVHRQGGGMLDIPQAVSTDVFFRTSKISVGEGERGARTFRVRMYNTGDEEKTFTLGVKHGVTTAGPTQNPSFYAKDGTVKFSADEVTLPANGQVTFSVTISEDFKANGAIYGGWITLNSASETLSVPFAGLSGDYQALRALQAAGLFFRSEWGLAPTKPFQPFTMKDGNFPHIALMLDYPAKQVNIDLFKANPDGSKGDRVQANAIGVMSTEDWGRTDQPRVIQWDGTYQVRWRGAIEQRTAKDGDYVLELRVLRALGDPKNPDHWDTWDSPAFKIDRKGGEGASSAPSPAAAASEEG